MASAIQEAELSDIDWLVMRARSFPKSDPYSAKAWLITAKSLFPQSFVIQFESYMVEKNAKNVEEAARHLQEMLQNFPTEPRLWEEVHDILEALQKEPQEHKISFLTELFAAIPTPTQCQMLLRVSEGIPQLLDRCQLLLWAMRTFPNLVQELGLQLVALLVKEETNSGIVNNPVNCYRKLLVCDVMPLVLQRSGHVEVNMFHLYVWLQRAIEFYVSFVTQQKTAINPEAQPDAETPKPELKVTRGMSEVTDPWGNLLKLLLLIGHRLNWDLERDLVVKTKEYQIQCLQHQLSRGRISSTSSEGEAGTSKQLLYTSMVLYFYALVNYMGHLDITGTQSHQVPVILLENLSKLPADKPSPPRSKKAKLDPSAATPVIEASPAIPSSSTIVSLFELAVKCYDLLNCTEEMKFEFYNLCQNWHEDPRLMITYFQIDMHIYKGSYQEALPLLQGLLPKTKGRVKTRVSLQMACCFFRMKKYSKACEMVMEVIDSIPQSQSAPSSSPGAVLESDTEETASESSARHLVMIPCTDQHLLPFCLQLLITGLKEKALSPTGCEDRCLAHLMVLLQHDWPRQEDLFSKLMTQIQAKGSFTFNMFFSYIHQVDMLEEFAFLDSADGGNIHLDIMPVSTKTIAQQRTVTRGVNKGVKEDFKAALEKQVGQIPPCMDLTIRTFLKEEKDEIIKSLT